jgi:hypothetical protein
MTSTSETSSYWIRWYGECGRYLAAWLECNGVHTVHVGTGRTTEYTECWPCPLFDILLNKYFPAG